MRGASECRAALCRLRPSLSRQAARAEGSTSPTTSGSRSCKGCPSDPSRTPPAKRHPRPQHLGSPLPVGRLPRRVASECHKALLQASALSIAGWPKPSAGESGPFALPALPGFIARTDPSVPAPRIGTLLLMGLPLGGLPWHQGTGSHVPHKSLALVSRRLHAGRHSDSRQAPSEPHPRPTTGAWFRRHPYAFDTSSTVHLRSSYQQTPDGFSPPFPQRSPPQPLCRSSLR